MNKKSLIYHIVWSITFIVLCYVFGSIYSLITNGFVIERKLQYITIAVICKPIMYLILGLRSISELWIPNQTHYR